MIKESFAPEAHPGKRESARERKCDHSCSEVGDPPGTLRGCGPLRAFAKQSFVVEVESFQFKQETAAGSSSGRQQSSKVSPKSTSSKEFPKS